MFSMNTSAASSLADQERALLIRVARCPLIREALGDSGRPCREVVTVQDDAEGDRQVPEAWAGNLRKSRVVFVSSNPSISTAGQGQPPSTAEAYPAAAWPNDKIVEFLGRRFDQSVRPRPYVRDFRHL